MSAGLLGTRSAAQHRQIRSAHSLCAEENNVSPQTAKSPFKAAMSAPRQRGRTVLARALLQLWLLFSLGLEAVNAWSGGGSLTLARGGEGWERSSQALSRSSVRVALWGPGPRLSLVAPTLHVVPLLSRPHCPAQQGKCTGRGGEPPGSSSVVTYYVLWPGA